MGLEHRPGLRTPLDCLGEADRLGCPGTLEPCEQEVQAPETHTQPPHWRFSRLRGIVFLVKETEVWDLKTDLGGVQMHAGAHSRRAAPAGGAKLCVKHSPPVQLVAYPHCYTYKYYQKLPLKEVDRSAQSHPAASGAEGTHVLSAALCCGRPLPFLLSHPSFSWLRLSPAPPSPHRCGGSCCVPEGSRGKVKVLLSPHWVWRFLWGLKMSVN